VNILFIGDIVGRPGRDLVKRAVPALVERHHVDFVIANVENAAAGAGITGDLADWILGCGVDVMTTGNHVWDKKELLEYISRQPKLIRPANYPAGAPGHGRYVGRTPSGVAVAVLNVMGRVFMSPLDNPFKVVLEQIAAAEGHARIIVVDFHAEATSEKCAMGWHLDGRVTALVGTHTHVQSADERVLPGGTAYITDVGMTGPHDSIIGMDKQSALSRFVTGMPSRLEPATGDPRVNAVIITADERTGRAEAIARVNLSERDVREMASPSMVS
jgi:metallophosphoesterase (TIGR00282 family)